MFFKPKFSRSHFFVGGKIHYQTGRALYNTLNRLCLHDRAYESRVHCGIGIIVKGIELSWKCQEEAVVDGEADGEVEEEAEEDDQLFRGTTQMNPMPDPLSCSR